MTKVSSHAVTGLCALAIVLVGGAGCTTNDDQLRVRAAFDLRCDAERLEVFPISENTTGVRGCDRQATYMRVDGSWLMNGSASEVK